MEQYELIIQYQHCFGKTQHVAGTAESESKAREWVKKQELNNDGSYPRVESDPVCTCNASFCQFKFQRPTFTYRIMKDPATETK